MFGRKRHLLLELIDESYTSLKKELKERKLYPGIQELAVTEHIYNSIINITSAQKEDRIYRLEFKEEKHKITIKKEDIGWLIKKLGNQVKKIQQLKCRFEKEKIKILSYMQVTPLRTFNPGNEMPYYELSTVYLQEDKNNYRKFHLIFDHKYNPYLIISLERYNLEQILFNNIQRDNLITEPWKKAFLIESRITANLERTLKPLALDKIKAYLTH